MVRVDLGMRDTYENRGLERARLLLANAPDMINTNIVLTAREVSEQVPLAATATNREREAVPGPTRSS